MRQNMKPVLIYTDDGRDVDDIEAISYLVGCKDVDIVGIVTTHMIPDRRAMIVRQIMDHFGRRDVPIGVGSVFPIGKEDAALVKYLREHSIKGTTYEGEGMIECFPDGIDMINQAINAYGRNLSIVVQAPLTDLAKAYQKDPMTFAKVGALYIQGNAKIDGGRLIPDPAAYNMSEDLKAAEIVLEAQDHVAMTFVGKWTAYQMPLTKEDFDLFTISGHPVGQYMRTHAYKGLECFVERAPDIFKKVFGIPAEQDAHEALKSLDKLSNPYDAVTAMAMMHPEYFQGIRLGQHRLIGMTKDDQGIVDVAAAKKNLVETIMRSMTMEGFD